MKKIVFVLVVFAVCMSCAYGAGGIAGHIYSTDILAYVNGMPVESYSIDGKTAVAIEDLYSGGYGFTYDYDNTLRVLKSDAYWHDDYILEDVKSVERGQVGQILGDIYKTDISVFINGNEVKGYAIDGKIAVAIEDLGTVDAFSPNREYGYSKYLCNFEWNAEERTVSLNFISGLMLHSVDIPSIKFLSRDNVLSASYDPMNAYTSFIVPSGGRTFDNTEEFNSEKYILKPLYLEINDQREEIGLCFADEEGNTQMFFKDASKIKALLSLGKTEPLSCDEALEFLDDGESYSILDKTETEDYMFIAVRDLKTEDSVYYVIVKKSGGFVNAYSSSADYYERIIEKTGVNTITVTEGPFAGPPLTGTTKRSMEFKLDNYIIG